MFQRTGIILYFTPLNLTDTFENGTNISSVLYSFCRGIKTSLHSSWIVNCKILTPQCTLLSHTMLSHQYETVVAEGCIILSLKNG